MGIYLLPYGVKLEKVKSSFNSKDEELFNKIKKTESFDCYASQDGDYPIKIEEALGQIIFGEEKDQSFPPAYGYALITIVDYFGEYLSKEGDIFKFGSVNENIEKKLKGYKIEFKIDELIEPILKFDIPQDSNDFPTIGGISKEKLESIRPCLDSIEITKENLNWEKESYNEELEAIYVLRNGVNYCLNHNIDWVSFAH